MSFRPLTYKKVYVNSQYRVSDSKSTSDFKIELQDTFEIPGNTIMQVHEVAIPNAWYSINTNNQNLYFRHQILPPATPQGITYRRIEIPVGNYTAPALASAMETQLNTFFDSGGRTNSYSAIYDTLTNKITISSNYSEVVFIPLTDTDVPTFVGSFSNFVDLNNLNSINNVLGFTAPVGDAFTSSSPWTTGFINLINYPDVYISCPELSNNNFHSPSDFSNAIIKKVPVNAPFAGIISDSYGITDYDYINVSKRNIKRLTFRIMDGAGNVIDLNGINVNFSLLFQNRDMT